MEEEHNFLSAASFCPTSQETGDRSGIAHLVKCPKQMPYNNQQNEDVLGTWVQAVRYGMGRTVRYGPYGTVRAVRYSMGRTVGALRYCTGHTVRYGPHSTVRAVQ